MTNEELDRQKAAIKERLELVRADGRQLLIRAIRDLIQATDGLESIGWKQYTSYYCDGDPCEFGVLNDEPMINGISGWDYETDPQSDYVLRYEPYLQAVRGILGSFAKEDYLLYFGDHQQITITATAAKIESYTQHD